MPFVDPGDSVILSYLGVAIAVGIVGWIAWNIRREIRQMKRGEQQRTKS